MKQQMQTLANFALKNVNIYLKYQSMTCFVFYSVGTRKSFKSNFLFVNVKCLLKLFSNVF